MKADDGEKSNSGGKMGKVLLHNLKTDEDYVFERDFSIGKATYCDLILSDPYVAQVHARLECRNGNTWYISDCSHGSGIWMNNFRVPEEGSLGLRNDCQLRFGNTALLFTADEKAVESAMKRLGKAKNAEPARLKEQPQARQNQQKEKAPSKLSKKAKTSILILAACLICVLGWCGINHISGTTALENQNYTAAIAALKRDFLFGGGELREAYRQAGENAFAQKDFEAASYYFLDQGTDGRTRWSDAIYEWGRQLLQTQRPEEAVEVLQQIADETRAKEQIGAAQSTIARQLIDEQDYQGAIDLAGQIENTKFADVDALINDAYRGMAVSQLEQFHFDAALDSFSSCTGDPVAEKDKAILQQMIDKEYYQAAQAAADSLQKEETAVSEELWLSCLNKLFTDSHATELNDRLEINAAKLIIDGSSSVDLDNLKSRIRAIVPTKEMIGRYTNDKEDSWELTSLSDFYSGCGAAANGKIAIVYQNKDYPNGQNYTSLRLDVMRLLPPEYYPCSLDEVEYVIVVNYSYIKEGFYTHTTVALQENATVETFRLPGRSRMNSSGQINGPEAPDTFMYIGEPPVWKSGGPPNVGEALYNALSQLLS